MAAYLEIKKTPRELRPKSHPLGVIRHLNSGPGGPVFSWHPKRLSTLRPPSGVTSDWATVNVFVDPACVKLSASIDFAGGVLISRGLEGFQAGLLRTTSRSRKVFSHSRNLGRQTRPDDPSRRLHCDSCLEGNLQAPHERRETSDRACGSTRKGRTAVSPAGSERIEPAGDLRVVEPTERHPQPSGCGKSPGDGRRRQRSSERCRSST
jgi:hypothetical protein